MMLLIAIVPITSLSLRTVSLIFFETKNDKILYKFCTISKLSAAVFTWESIHLLKLKLDEWAADSHTKLELLSTLFLEIKTINQWTESRDFFLRKYNFTNFCNGQLKNWKDVNELWKVLNFKIKKTTHNTCASYMCFLKSF